MMSQYKIQQVSLWAKTAKNGGACTRVCMLNFIKELCSAQISQFLINLKLDITRLLEVQ